MLNNLKNTFKHIVIYSLGNLSSKIVGFILLPIYTSYLTTAEYGVLAILEITSQFLVVLFGVKITAAIMRWWTDENYKEEKKSIVFSALIVVLVSILLINLLFQPFKEQISILFFNSGNYISYFTVLLISASLEIFSSFNITLIRLKEKSILFVTIVFFRLLITMLLTIYLVVYKNWGILGILFSQMIGSGVVLLSSLPTLIKSINLRFKIIILKDMLKYSVPLIFSSLSVLLLTLGDRFILKYLKAYSDVGVYSLAYKVAGVLNVFIIQSFQMGFAPIAFKMFNKPNAKRFFSKMFTYFALVLVFFALVISIFSKEVIILFAKNNPLFWKAIPLVPILCITYSLKGLEYIVIFGLHYAKKTKFIAYIVIIGASLNLIFNFLLIPVMGIYGAAVTSLASQLLVIFLIYQSAQKFYKIDYEIIKVLKIFFIAIVFFAISYSIQHMILIPRLGIKVILLISFPVILYYWNFFEEIELIRIKQAWAKWKNPFSWKNNLKSIKKQD